MVLEGFKSRSRLNGEGEKVVEYAPKGGKGRRQLRLRINKNGNFVVELLENGVVPGVALGERVTCPVYSAELEGRLLMAMALHHFRFPSSENGHSIVDVEMISRGFDVGKLKSGELIWFRCEHGATFVVKREDSDQLPSWFTQPTRLVVVGITGKELVAKALDFRSLIRFMEANGHYEMYQPYHNIHIPGFYSDDLLTFH
jgi:hypothetical protein